MCKSKHLDFGALWALVDFFFLQRPWGCASVSWLGWISISFRADLAAFVQVGGARFFDDFFDDITSAGLVLPDANQSAV